MEGPGQGRARSAPPPGSGTCPWCLTSAGKSVLASCSVLQAARRQPLVPFWRTDLPNGHCARLQPPSSDEPESIVGRLPGWMVKTIPTGRRPGFTSVAGGSHKRRLVQLPGLTSGRKHVIDTRISTIPSMWPRDLKRLGKRPCDAAHTRPRVHRPMSRRAVRLMLTSGPPPRSRRAPSRTAPW